ncbi:MAG: DUF4352 domain-containing protein [archaeon]
MKFKHSFLFILILVAVVFVSGCSSDTEYVQPEKLESSTSGSDLVENTPEPVKTTEIPEPIKQAEPEPPKVQIFNVGDTATDKELKVTVNKVRFTSKIDEKDNQFMIAEAPSGKQYAIIDITIENILADKTQSISTTYLTTVNDQDGYDYEIDFEAQIALDKSFKDGEILPTMKKRGEIVYLVPSDVTDLKFIYKYDLVSGTSAVFDIK